MEKFIHLRVHSDYSLLKATNKPKKLVQMAIENKMPALALTDYNNLYGALEFAELAASSGVQPIIGCNFTVKYLNFACEIILLAKSEIGFKNLIELALKHSQREFELTEIFSNKEGLILLTGNLPIICIKQNLNIKDLFLQLKQVFQGDFYIEISRIEQNQYEKQLISLAYEYEIPLVATNAVLFPTKEFTESHDVLSCIANGQYLSSEDRKISSDQCYFKSTEEMHELFSDLEEAIENTVIIAKKCCFMPEVKKPILPKFPCRDESDEMTKKATSGLKSKFKEESEIPQEYLKRLEYELSVIIKMEYSGYFLIVADFINWSKKNNIPVGPGRGSGVGSIVAWALGITALDPIKFGLLFERFLNPVRVSMPDFDIDFCQEKRNLVIEYVQKKYGYVAQIVTFGSLQPRAALRDVGRVLQLPYTRVDKICKMIPFNPANPITLPEAIELDQNLQQERNNDEVIAKLLDIALKLEGVYRHASTHAAGVVISDKPITDYIPIYYDAESNLPITQYSMKYVEKAGLIKFDFLGLKTLTTINKATELIKTHNPEFNIEKILLDDEKTFQMLSEGKSIGSFQLENAFMCEVLKKLKPDCIEDIIALVSLNRPGPMSNIPMYINRKHKREIVEYPHPLLKDVLAETFGIVIYQEQVMEVARILAGYSLAEADILRRAMGKKIRLEMAKQKEKFVKGAIANSIEEEKAKEIFDMVEKFAGYGFNKSHAAAYALIAYQTAYLKANYTIEFLVATLNLEINNTDKIAIFINEAKLFNIKILPPDVNKSGAYFAIEDGAIRYSLAALKNVGEGAAEFLQNCEKFNNLQEFAKKIDKKLINKRALEGLIKCGAMDCLHNNRAELFASVAQILSYEDNSSQILLFNATEDNLISKNLPQWNFLEKCSNELSSIGFFLNNHPITIYKNLLKLPPTKIAAVITNVKIRSRGVRKFAVLQLSTIGNIYTVIFYDSEVIENKLELFTVGLQVMVDIANNNNGIVGKNIFKLENAILQSLQNKIAIKIIKEGQIHELKKVLKKNGKFNVILFIEEDESFTKVMLEGRYNFSLKELLLVEEIECFRLL